MDHEDFPTLLAEAMDVLAGHEMDVRLAAQTLQITPSQLIKFLKLEPRAIAKLNDWRRQANLHPLW